MKNKQKLRKLVKNHLCGLQSGKIDHSMLNKTISVHLNALKILNCCLYWPWLAFSCVFGLGQKCENITSSPFSGLFPLWPNRNSGVLLLNLSKLILKQM